MGMPEPISVRRSSASELMPQPISVCTGTDAVTPTVPSTPVTFEEEKVDEPRKRGLDYVKGLIASTPRTETRDSIVISVQESRKSSASPVVLPAVVKVVRKKMKLTTKKAPTKRKKGGNKRTKKTLNKIKKILKKKRKGAKGKGKSPRNKRL